MNAKLIYLTIVCFNLTKNTKTITFDMIYNKTGLKPVSRPVEQVSLIRGLAVCAKACRFQGYANKQYWWWVGAESLRQIDLFQKYF